MRFPYYPGCTLKTTAKNFEISAIASARALGIELVELPRWNCCGAVYSLVSDNLMSYLAPIRNLIRVQEMNEKGILENEYRLVTLCDMCYNTLKRANLLVKEDPEKLEKINTFMDREEDYKGNVEVLHFLEVLRDVGFKKVEEKVKNPLKGLKIAPYYGCMILRPRGIGIDDPEDPKILNELLEALGAEVVDNPYKVRCCGSYQTVNRKYVVAELAHDILSHAVREGAEAIALSCPLCSFNLDDRQKEVKELHPNFREIPVFYFTQLMAIAFGLEEKSYGLNLNYVDPRPLLKNKKLLKTPLHTGGDMF
ncbi:CoB--CoM heterodisulfide reductase iron-sulfur subunit B family protein [Candidatus Bathyarchaeota archaeon]|nr:CoB--CoM heterodisulfide reductase iron-sulfur subunit B family protein [Candidatus Bathyarchaeota archaeon]